MSILHQYWHPRAVAVHSLSRLVPVLVPILTNSRCSTMLHSLYSQLWWAIEKDTMTTLYTYKNFITITILTSPVHSNIWMTDIALSARRGMPGDLDVLSLSRIISIDSIFTVIYNHNQRVKECMMSYTSWLETYNFSLLLSHGINRTCLMEWNCIYTETQKQCWYVHCWERKSQAFIET